jgi:predicted phosphoadenosine phosphosulfate sulfurtransferase
MFMDNYSYYTKMRVSNLVHEKSYKCLVDLPKYEPETYNKLCRRISGIATAARYASEKLVFSNKKLPEHYKCWKEFRDFLLENIKDDGQKQKYLTRFAKQATNERIYQAQVGQLLINDYENSRAFNTTQEAKVKEMKDKWQAIL